MLTPLLSSVRKVECLNYVLATVSHHDTKVTVTLPCGAEINLASTQAEVLADAIDAAAKMADARYSVKIKQEGKT